MTVAKETRIKAVEMMRKGVPNKTVSQKLGVSMPMLRVWKSRYIAIKANDQPNAPKGKNDLKPFRALKVSDEVKYTTDQKKTTKHDLTPYDGKNERLEALEIANDALLQAYSEAESEYHKAEKERKSVTDENKALRNEIEALKQPTDSKTKDNALIVAIVALHVSAIYGVGEILSDVFHTCVMGYLTATVFVCAGLIMFVSKRFSVGISWIVLFATFILESYCNYLTIYLNMEVAQLEAFATYTNPTYLFAVIAVFVPLVNLALEYLLFVPTATTDQNINPNE